MLTRHRCGSSPTRLETSPSRWTCSGTAEYRSLAARAVSGTRSRCRTARFPRRTSSRTRRVPTVRTSSFSRVACANRLFCREHGREGLGIGMEDSTDTVGARETLGRWAGPKRGEGYGMAYIVRSMLTAPTSILPQTRLVKKCYRHVDAASRLCGKPLPSRPSRSRLRVIPCVPTSPLPGYSKSLPAMWSSLAHKLAFATGRDESLMSLTDT